MSASPSESVPDVRKSVTVPVSPERAFAIFAQYPLEWFPERHVFVKDRQALTIEPHVGGRYYERGADGTEIAWGTVVAWEPDKRIVLTWRVGPGWQPIFDDETASFIEVDFVPAGPQQTVVSLTHSGLERHGQIAPMIRAALDGPDPGETLAKYSSVVARRSMEQVSGPITLLNTFTVTGSGDEFEKIFEETSDFFAAQPGFIDHALMRQLGQPQSYVNVARWSDQPSLMAALALPQFQPHARALRAVSTSKPVLFSVRSSVQAQADA
jgi:uncharacterized protein YndB with AHSA1/START domain/quinol monooxygenase YgiN